MRPAILTLYIIVYILLNGIMLHAQQNPTNNKSGTMKIRKAKASEAEKKAKDELSKKLKF